MSEWKTYKLGEIGKIITGKTPPTANAEYFGDEYPFITPRDMNTQKVILSTERYLSKKGKELLKNNLLPPKSICISCIGSDLGKVVVTLKDSFTNQQLNSIICNENFDKNFIYYVCIQLSETIRSIGKSSTAVPIVNKSTFSELEFSAPDLATQTQIAQILTSLDDKIELNLQMNQTLEAMAQALFKEWFVDFNFPNFDGELQNDLPKGWRLGSLSEIINFVVDNRGKTPNSLIEKENNYPLIEVNSLINSRVVTQQHLAKKYVDEETYNNWFRKGHPQKGDVLFSTVGSIGEISLVFDEKFCIAQNIIALRSIFNGSFLFFTLKNLKQSLLSLDISSVQPSIKVPHLLKSEILIPNEEIIKDYEESILPIIEKINENSIQIQSLTQTRDTLLPKLMSGQIAIK
jgi:type I restriction enzyme S subunit